MPPSHWVVNPWFNIQPRRVKEAMLFHTNSDGKTICSIDLHPRIDRCSKGHNDHAQTLTPASKIWLLAPEGQPQEVQAKFNRMLTGFEALGIQGFPLPWIGEKCTTSDPQLADVAGNAFSSSVFSAIFVALLALLPDAGPKKAICEGEVDMERIMGLMT